MLNHFLTYLLIFKISNNILILVRGRLEMTKKKDIKIDGQLFIGEDNLIKDSEDINVITEENLKEYADMLQFDTLAQECILED